MIDFFWIGSPIRCKSSNKIHRINHQNLFVMKKVIYMLLAFIVAVIFMWFFHIRIEALLWLSLVFSVLLLVFRYCVISKIVQNYELSEEDALAYSDNSVWLFTLNGFGTRFYGSFRHQDRFYVTYRYICLFFIPVIPIGCYLVSDAADDSYNVYGNVGMRKYECADIYLKWYGWLGAILSLIFVMVSF